jgi:hypothetical protein
MGRVGSGIVALLWSPGCVGEGDDFLCVLGPCLCHVQCLLVSEGPDIALSIMFNLILE